MTSRFGAHFIFLSPCTEFFDQLKPPNLARCGQAAVVHIALLTCMCFGNQEGTVCSPVSVNAGLMLYQKDPKGRANLSSMPGPSRIMLMPMYFAWLHAQDQIQLARH